MNEAMEAKEGYDSIKLVPILDCDLKDHDATHQDNKADEDDDQERNYTKVTNLEVKSVEEHHHIVGHDGYQLHSECYSVAKKVIPRNHVITNRHAAARKRQSVDGQRHAPLDGGWGWCIVLAALIVYILVGSMWRTYGIIYLHLRETFHSSAAVSTWLGGVCAAMLVCTPIVNALGSLLSTRTVALAGALCIFLGFFLSAFATGPWYMLFTYSLLAGFGGAMMYVPSLVQVVQYFDRRRGIATGIATSGTGLGTICIAPLMEYFFITYGWFGAMLIMSAVMLHIMIAASLWRPLEDNYPQQKHKLNAAVKSKKAIAPRSRLDIAAYRRLCGNPRFIILSFTLGATSMSYMAAPIFLPEHAKSVGASEERAVLLLSIMGIGEMFSRLLVGMFFDIPIIRRHRKHWYNIATLGAGATCFLWAYGKSYEFIAVSSALHSVFSGCVSGQRATMVADLMGVEILSTALGLYCLIEGVGLMSGPPITGVLRDVTQSYIMSFVFCGSVLMFCSLTFFAISFIPDKTPSYKDDADVQDEEIT